MARKTKHHSNYKTSYRKNFSKKDKDFLGNPLIITIIIVIILYTLFTILFWLGIIGFIGAVFYGIHYLNKRFGGYNTKYYFAPIISNLIGALLSIILTSFVLVQYGKIDAQIFSLAKSGSDYITIGNKPKYGSSIELDEKGIATKIATSQIEDPSLKQAVEMPSTVTEKIVDSIQEWFLNIFK